MTAQNRTQLKALFETGDTVTQGSFENLIDSFLDLVEVSSQTIASPVVFSNTVTFSSAASFTTPIGVASGGTGLINVSAYALIVGNNTSTPALISPSSTSGVPLISQGVSANPIYGTAVVAGGGTGKTSFTSNSVICGGTTSTGVVQSVDVSAIPADYVLTYVSAAALPIWAPNAAIGGIVAIANGGTASATAVSAFSALKQDATTSTTGVVELATNAEVTTGTDTSRVSPISSMIYHKGIGKSWVNFTGTGTVTINDSLNVSSITDNGTGDYTINFSPTFSSANYSATCMGLATPADITTRSSVGIKNTGGMAAGSLRIITGESDVNVQHDLDRVCVAVLGAY